MKNAVEIVLKTEKFFEKTIDQNFKESITKIIENKSIRLDLVNLSTAQQAKRLLDFFNNNRFILAGLSKEDSIFSPVEQVISEIDKHNDSSLDAKDLKIAKALLLSKGITTSITKLTNSHMNLKDVLKMCSNLKNSGFGELIEIPTKVKGKTKKVIISSVSFTIY